MEQQSNNVACHTFSGSQDPPAYDPEKRGREEAERTTRKSPQPMGGGSWKGGSCAIAGRATTKTERWR